jgi:beta-fructofuranosidase
MKRREFLIGGSLLPAISADRVIESGSPVTQHIKLAMPLAADPLRPQYHLLPPANWMNDPNGPIFWNGHYHMFYQYNPNAAVWGDMHWGHAVSPDMVHWKHLPVALSPTPGGPDAAGCFSGSAIVDRGIVNVLYTGVVSVPKNQATIKNGAQSFRESQCLAFSTDLQLKTWSKLPAPVIAAPPAHLNVTGFRDPSAWRTGDSWYMTVGSGIPRQGGAVLLYRSTDLRHWHYEHCVATGARAGAKQANPVDSGDMWECPDLFPLDGRHVLIYSTQGKVHWQSGYLDEKAVLFHPQLSGILDHGAYYAAKSQLDAQGNRIVWGWIPETRPVEQYRAAGWAGMMSLPRALSLDDHGRLRMEVFDGLHALRRRETAVKLRGADRESQVRLSSMVIENCCGEIRCVIEKMAKPVAVALVGLLNGRELPDPLVRLNLDPRSPDQIFVEGEPVSIARSSTGATEVQVYIDQSVAEIIMNKSAAYTKRFYYGGSQAPAVKLRLDHQPDAAHISIWQIAPISPDRLTTS